MEALVKIMQFNVFISCLYKTGISKLIKVELYNMIDIMHSKVWAMSHLTVARQTTINDIFEWLIYHNSYSILYYVVYVYYLIFTISFFFVLNPPSPESTVLVKIIIIVPPPIPQKYSACANNCTPRHPSKVQCLCK